jgi:tetratricopeptide (TPR) repeat protein
MLIDKVSLDSNLAVDYANTSYALGDNYLKLGNYQKAYSWYFKGISVVKHTHDECVVSNYNYRIAMMLYRQGHYQDAIEYFQVCLTQLKNCDKQFPLFYRQQELLNNIALSYTRQNKYDSAMMYYNKALAFLGENKIDMPHPRLYVQVASGVIYGNMAKVFRAKGDYKRAEELLKESVRLNLHSEGEIKDAQISLLELAHVYHDQHRLDDIRLADGRAQDFSAVLGGDVVEHAAGRQVGGRHAAGLLAHDQLGREDE